MRRSLTTVLLPVVCTLLVLLSGQVAVAADPADAFWSDAYYNAGIQGTVKAMVSQPGALYVGGSFTSIGQLPVANVARLNTTDGVVTSATALGEGLPGWVYALGLHDGDVVAGGSFGTSGDTVLNSIARWDGTAWQPFGAGLPGVTVRAVASYGGRLYAGGYSWDGESWSYTLPTNGSITGLVVQDGLLYVSGSFTMAGTDSVSNVFVWDGTSVQPLGAGLPSAVSSSVATPEGVVLAVGWSVGPGSVQRWDGAQWIVEQEGTSVESVGLLGDELLAANMVVINSYIYWPELRSLQNGVWTSVGGFMTELMVEHEGVLFMAVPSGVQPGLVTPGLIAYDGTGMRAAFAPNRGFDNGFRALSVYSTGALAGGDFAVADGQVCTGAALAVNDAWVPLGSVSELPSAGGFFVDMEVLGDTVYGLYSYSEGDISSEALTKLVWDSGAWQWQKLSYSDWYYGDLVVAGGVMYSVAGDEVAQVEPVTGLKSQLPGLDLDSYVIGACAHNDELVICGRFTTNGGVLVSNVLRYRDGTWQDVGTALPGDWVTAVTGLAGAELAATFKFEDAYHVALFDGMDWTILPGDFDRAISEMVYHRDRLFVAGLFDWVGPVPAQGIAAWTGSRWSPVGSGLPGPIWGGRVQDMITDGESLWVAGRFTSAGGKLSVGLAEWTGDPAMLTGEPTGVEATVPAAAHLLGSPYPNPFNPRTSVAFTVPQGGRVWVGVFNLKGGLVRVLTDRVYPAGDHAVQWNGLDDAGRAQPSGVYFARLLAGERHEAVKLTLVR